MSVMAEEGGSRDSGGREMAIQPKCYVNVICNPLKGCISRNIIFTPLLTYSLRGSKLIQRIEENEAVEG